MLTPSYLVIGRIFIGRGLFLLGSRFRLNFFWFFFLLILITRVIRRRLFFFGSFLEFRNCSRFLYLLFFVRGVFIRRGLFLLGSSSRLSLNFFSDRFCFFLVIGRVFVGTFFFGSRFSFYLFSDWKIGFRNKLDFNIIKTNLTSISLKPRLINHEPLKMFQGLSMTFANWICKPCGTQEQLLYATLKMI